MLNSDGTVKEMKPPAGFFPDQGFGHGRPDLRVYGVA